MPLLKRADVLVEQFRPGVMARLGLGYEALRRINPRLVYCSITGYGQTGPRAGEAGHDLNYIGHTGLLALQPGPPDRPVVPPALIADIAGGTLPAVINILLALRQRDRTGQGCHLDIAMTDAMFTFAGHALAVGHATGAFPGAGGARLTGGSPRYQLYPTRDGKLVACAALEQKFWLAFTRGDRACAASSSTTAAIRRRPRRRSRAIIAGRDRRRMAAGARRGRLLRHHRGDAGGGAARSAFRRARAVRAQGRGRIRRDHAGAAGADRSGVSRASRKPKPLPTLGADDKLATAPRRASGAAAKRQARRPRAARRGATGRSGRSGRGRGRARPAPAGSPTAACG